MPTLDRIERVLFGVALLLLLVPVWGSPLYLMQDGPRHVEIARLTQAFLGTPSLLVEQTYESTFIPLPNWTTCVFLIPLQRLVGDTLAIKLLASLYILALPLSARGVMHWTEAKNPVAVWLLLPFVHSLLLAFGLLNFLLALPLLILSLGLATRLARERERAHWAWFVPLSTTLYFTHPLVLCVSLLCCGTLLGWESLRRRTPVPVAKLMLSTSPATLLLIWFLMLLPTTDPAGLGYEYGTATRLNWLLTGNIILQSSVWDILFGFTLTVLAVATMTLAVRTQLRAPSRLRNAMTLPLLAVTAFYLLTPDNAGAATLIGIRSQIFVVITFALWVANWPSPRPMQWCLCLAGFAITTGLVGLRLQQQFQLNDAATDILKAAPYIPKQSRMLAVQYAESGLHPDGSPVQARTKFLLAAHVLLHPLTQGVDVNSYQAHHGVFPIRFRKGRDAYPFFASPSAVEVGPRAFDIAGYEAETGLTVDVVLVMGRTAQTAGGDLEKPPSENYVLAWSNPEGFPVEVWLRNDPS